MRFCVFHEDDGYHDGTLCQYCGECGLELCREKTNTPCDECGYCEY